ncbi:MAG: hypothetical protein ABSH20_06575 [Tepidisphaeraceae bacterium]|jgi:hypothetical protein
MTASRPQHEFYTLLRKHAVPFVVIGGHAVQFHGYVRNTEDVDLVWMRSAESEAKLAAALQEANATWISDERDPQTGLEKLIPVSLSYVRANHLMMLCTDYGFVDLFDYIPGFPIADVGEVYRDSVLAGDIHYVSIDWLRKMKQAADRPKDRLDLEKLP